MIVVCYDISSNRRRYRVERTLQGYGNRVQKSIFECHLDKQELQALKIELEEIINQTEDNLLFYSLCNKDYSRVTITGLGELTENWDFQLY